MRNLIIGIIVGLTATAALAADPPQDPIAGIFESPYTAAEIAGTLAPYHFRQLTREDWPNAPDIDSIFAEDDFLSEVSGWARVNENGNLVLFQSRGSTDSDQSCLPVKHTAWLFSTKSSAEVISKEPTNDPRYWDGKFVRLIGQPRYNPYSGENEFGGGWVMYPPLSVPDQQNCGTDIGFDALEILLGR